MFKLRIYSRHNGLRATFVGSSVEDCERQAEQAGWFESSHTLFLR